MEADVEVTLEVGDSGGGGVVGVVVVVVVDGRLV